MRRVLRKSLVAVAVALAVSPQVSAQSLKDVVVQTIESNPTVLSSVRKKDAADEAIEAAKGGYYPRIDYLYGAGNERSENSTTIAQLLRPGYLSLHRKQEGGILNQMLWDGFGVKSEVDRRRAISDSSGHKAYGTVEEIALQAVDAYLSVLRSRQNLEYAKENLQAHQRTFDQVKLRSDKGLGRRADLEQVEARFALSQANVAAAESTLRDTEIAYLKVVGKMPGTLTLPKVPNLPKTVDEAVKIGLDGNPILKSAQSDIEAAQAQREIARSFFSPRVEFEASYTNNDNIDGIRGPNNDRMVMLWLKWNIFRGFYDKHRLSETSYQIGEASEIARNTYRQVENAVRLAYNAYATARERLPQLERYVKASDATRAAYQQQFAIGQRTLLDLLDSENEYYTSRTERLSAQFIEYSSRYRVLGAMGQLLPALEVTPPEQAVVKSR